MHLICSRFMFWVLYTENIPNVWAFPEAHESIIVWAQLIIIWPFPKTIDHQTPKPELFLKKIK